MQWNVNAAGTDCVGIMVWGNSGMTYNQPMVTVRDVQITYGGYDYSWDTGMRFIDCRELTLDNCRLRKEANAGDNTAVGSGFKFESCMGGNISNCTAWGYAKNFHLTKADDSLIKDAVTKHGSEGMYFTNCHTAYGTDGFVVGYKCAFCKFQNIASAENAGSAWTEDITSGVANGGYHTIDGIYTDISNSAVALSPIVYIARPGTVISGGQINLEDKATNGIVIDGHSGNASLCRVNGLVIRNCGDSGNSGIWVYEADNCIVSENLFEGSDVGGYDITIAVGTDKTLVHGNHLDIALNDGGTNTTSSDNVEH